MNVLVVGGTGFIGSKLCGELVERGHDVTALSRDPSETALPDAVETYAGDVTDYDGIEGAFEGRDAVVYLVALSPLFDPKGGGNVHDRVHLGGTRNALAAAEAHGVERFVHMSALGADPDGPTAYLRAKGKAEQAVMESDRDWVVFRPSVVFGEDGEFVAFTKEMKSSFAPGLPFYPLPGGGKTPFQPIWVGDLVPMLADAVEDDAHVGEAYDVGGPAVVTLADVARMAFRAAGKSVNIVPLPMPLAKLGLTLMGPLPFVPFGPDQARSLELDNRVDHNDVDAFGVDPTKLRTVADYLGLEE
ncbi:MAG: complex I NDUFA9 subunit family protein [Halobacteriales archaeon]